MEIFSIGPIRQVRRLSPEGTRKNETERFYFSAKPCGNICSGARPTAPVEPEDQRKNDTGRSLNTKDRT